MLVLFIVVCLFMILLILIQKGRGGGLAGAFGGGGGGQSAFGSKTGDVLTWATSIVFGIFLILGIVLNLLANSLYANPTIPTPLPIPIQLPASDAPNTDASPVEAVPLQVPATDVPAPATNP